MEKQLRVLAVNDDRDFCECCGRQGLKRVVWIEDCESGVIKHFGTTCAAAPAKGFGLEKEIKRAIAERDHIEKTLNFITHRSYRESGGIYTDGSKPGTRKPADMHLWQSIRAKHAANVVNA